MGDTFVVHIFTKYFVLFFVLAVLPMVKKTLILITYVNGHGQAGLVLLQHLAHTE